MTFSGIAAIIAETVTLAGFAAAVAVWIKKLINGIKCQLRTDMLKTYYHNRQEARIRQYEYENFICNYEAYKVLKGNSFIDRIYAEVKTWEIVT